MTDPTTRVRDWTTDDAHGYEWCRVCLTVRQRDGSSDAKPCKGPARVGLRTDPTTRVRAILDAASVLPRRSEDEDRYFEAHARAIVLSRNLLPAALDVVEAARRREKAEEALADWDTLHGYVINAERDALANDRGEAVYLLRAALDVYHAKEREVVGVSGLRTEAGRALWSEIDVSIQSGGGLHVTPDNIAAIEAEAVDAYLASPEAAEELARALAQAEVGCWANRPVHGPEQDDEVHARDAVAVLAALRKERETLGS